MVENYSGVGSETIDVTSRIKNLFQYVSLEMIVDGFSDVAQVNVKGTTKSATGGEIRINIKDKK